MLKKYLYFKKKIIKMSGYALFTILNPQPDDNWAGHESLGKQFKISIDNIETNRSFAKVNKNKYF
jgi:hypothetical protein